MTIELPEDLAARIQEQVDSGEFATPLDVVRDALDQKMDDQVAWMTPGQLRREVAHAIAQSRRGESRPGEEVFQRLRERRLGAASK